MESRDDMMTDTEPSFESVPVVAEPPSRLSKPIKVLVIVGILTVFTLVGASLYQVPYFSQSPGAATALETSIEVAQGTVRMNKCQISAFKWLKETF